MITLLTPTRNRPRCFALLEKYMARQTVPWDQWLVVNDGTEPYAYTMGQQVIARDASQDEQGWYSTDYRCMIPHSICRNLQAAIPAIAGSKIIIVEDDDYYFPTFLETLSAALDQADLCGSAPARYYNLAQRRYKLLGNADYCSLAQTGFTRAVLPTFAALCKDGIPFVDIGLWSSWKGSKRIFPNDRQHIGLKGLWGERGIGLGHAPNIGPADPDLRVFQDWLGEDASNYL